MNRFLHACPGPTCSVLHSSSGGGGGGGGWAGTDAAEPWPHAERRREGGREGGPHPIGVRPRPSIAALARRARGPSDRGGGGMARVRWWALATRGRALARRAGTSAVGRSATMGMKMLMMMMVVMVAAMMMMMAR
eukprot:scaffold2295_cov354-Prasinococcus_capsulatus_cf.AAC.8